MSSVLIHDATTTGPSWIRCNMIHNGEIVQISKAYSPDGRDKLEEVKNLCFNVPKCDIPTTMRPITVDVECVKKIQPLKPVIVETNVRLL